MTGTTYVAICDVAKELRQILNDKKFIVLYGYNGIGKTRLSGAFKDLGKVVDLEGRTIQRDTLYFNAFTEDLFSWDNDIESDQDRVLELNDESTFFDGLRDFSMDVKIGQLLERYADFSFKIEYERKRKAVPPATKDVALRPAVIFFRDRDEEGDPIPIKVSRGEESLFIWCFFLAIVELAIAGEQSYQWVKYLFIDDPISSLDEQNAVALATHLASIVKDNNVAVKTVVSTHHPLFFNVLYNELQHVKGNRFFFLGKSSDGGFVLADTGDTPFFHHVACLLELHHAARSGQVFTHHFNMLRVIAEKTASFLGYDRFGDLFKKDESDADGVLHNRLLNLLSHGKYSLYEPRQMLDENKRHFKKMLVEFTQRFCFNPERFPLLALSTDADLITGDVPSVPTSKSAESHSP